MKILVTGAAGFIGSHFAEMASKDHVVVGVDLLTYSGRSKNIPGIRCVVGNIQDSDFISWVFREVQPDALVHFAAETHVARSIERRDEFLQTNVLGTNVLLEESLKYWRGPAPIGEVTSCKVGEMEFGKGVLYATRPFKFLYVSTDEVYGSLGPNEPAWTEQSPYAPNNPYAASKAAGDHLVRSYHHTYGLPVIITHSANNYGSRQHPEKLIPTLIHQALADEPMTLHGDGQNVRDWIHVADHCRGLLAALKRGRPGTVYNFGGQCERTNLSIAELVSRTLNKPMHTKFIPNRPGNDSRYSSAVGHSLATLDWLPGLAIEQRLGEVVQWYVDNPNYWTEYGR